MKVAIIDYGMGNVFSVRHACGAVGIATELVSEPEGLAGLDGVIIPGVGAMPDAMRTLRAQNLVSTLREAAADGLPILGICLGFQLLMERGTEFGEHEGLGLMPGEVVPLPSPSDGAARLPVPNVGWRHVHVRNGTGGVGPFGDLSDADELYFVHSYHVAPSDADMVVAESEFGDLRFCAAARSGNVFGCQFHPERSGPRGLEILEAFGSLVANHSPTP